MKDSGSVSREVMEVAFGGLLHDIGKVRQRMNPEGIYNKTNLEHFCPHRKGGRTHKHAGHTAEFLAECVDNNIFNENIRRIAASHHLDLSFKNTPAEIAVQIADRLASGMDRESYEKKEDESSEPEENQQGDYIRARLISIFSQLKLSEGESDEDYVSSIEKLRFDSLPQRIADISRETARDHYLKLWRSFQDDFEKIGSFSLDNNYLNALSSIMELYFWCVPASSYKSIPDHSLYDHCRLTSAIASSIYRYHEENSEGIVKKNYIDKNDIFLIIQGDFSGIQNFIFDFRGESHKYAAKILRARSFYVSIATEIVAVMICDALGIPHVSIILNAGGKFTIFAPNLEGSREKIARIKNEINSFFTDMSFGQTRFNIASLPVCGNDLVMGKNNPVGKIMKKLSVNLERDKLRPNIKEPVIQEYLDNFTGTVCPTCGYRSVDSGEICKTCNGFKRIGEDLVKSERSIISVGKGKDGHKLPGGWRFRFYQNNEKRKIPGSDLTYNLERFTGDSPTFEGIAIKFISNYTPTFREDEINQEKYESLSEKFPEEEFAAGSNKTFSHIGADGREKINSEFIGVPHIAALKADIDNMGEMFIKGFGNKTNFSKIVTLSRMFNFLFTGWLQRLLKSNKEYESVYTVFAGGDDLFLIGPWRSIMDLADHIDKHLDEYTAKHPGIHISAGIVLSRPQIPVRKLADRSEEYLEKSKKGDIGRAKNRAINVKSVEPDSGYRTKNKITVFERTVRWEDYRELKNFGDLLFKMMRDDNLSVSYIYNLFEFAEKRERQEEKPREARWHALFKYMTHRNYYDENSPELYNKLLGISELILEHGEDLKIALSRCLYRSRKR